MSGETDARRREAESGQPGGREPAPGALALVQEFVNSHYDLGINRGADRFAFAPGLRDWLLGRDLIDPRVQVVESDLERALIARKALRALAGARAETRSAGAAAIDALNQAALGATVELRFTLDGPEYVSTTAPTGVPGAIGLILAHTARAMIDGSWDRLKICPGDHCGWAFYDHSRNRTGRWCSMSVCGGRAKARAHYQRHRRGVDRS